MRYILLLLTMLFVLILCPALNAQTGISGMVTDGGNNLPLSGATIIVAKNQKNTISDVDGNFRITGLTPGIYVIKISYVGFDSKEIDGVQVAAGEITALNVSLNLSKSSTLAMVTVKTDVRKENLNSLLATRRNSPVVSDGISADLIRKSPDKNTSDVLKRISGTTIQENKFVVVRGMNDRYNEAMLNNTILPSSEPDRKTFAFDIFPSEIVDNITIIKSASSDLPGSFSGGLIQINTKDIPEKKFLSVKITGGYNSISTGKKYYDYKGGNRDWLGLDDGTRSLPFENISTKTYVKFQLNDPQQTIPFAKSLQNNWSVLNKDQAPFNKAIQVSGGFNLHDGKRYGGYPRFGGVFGLTYNSSFKFSEYRRLDYQDNFQPFFDYKDSVYTRNILTSALANLSLKLNANNKFYFNNIFSINSSDQIVLRSGPNFSYSWNDIRANSFFFVSNVIVNSQFGGDHVLTKHKFRIKWNAYYTSLSRNEPDYRRNMYFQAEQGSPYVALLTSGTSVISSSGVRYYAEVKDYVQGLNLDLSLPFKMFGQTQTYKFGGVLFSDNRERKARFFTAAVANPGSFNQNLFYAAQDTIYSPAHFDLENGFSMIEDNSPTNRYSGSVHNNNAYFLLDNKLTQNLRLIWGIRFEAYHNIVNTFIADVGTRLKIDTTYKDWLPSANLIYSVYANANIRASYSRTAARPQYRELANQLFYDFITNSTISGNPYLTETHISNYEVRWEQYFPGAQYYSLSAFYKKFENPIESYIVISGADSRTISYKNVANASIHGIELEARKNFDFISKKFENLVAYANISFIKSKTDEFTSKKDSAKRPLQGQSPYIVNVSLQYNDPKTNLGVSVLFNAIGGRLFLVGGLDQEPVWEKPHSALDFKLSKAFAKKGIIELTLADILHKNDNQFWDINKNKKYDPDIDKLIQSQTFGFNISLAVGYRF